MRREILAILILCALSSASLEQTYSHSISRDGSSAMTKDTDLTIFADVLGPTAFDDVESLCRSDASLRCSVDGPNKTVTITERFTAGSYYSFEADYGIPFITYTLVVKKVPTDRFSSSLDDLLVEAGVIDESGDGSVMAMDLRDEETNRENAYYFRRFNADLAYIIEMPSPVYEARAGNATAVISGNRATFDLVSVLEQSEYITVRSQELNLSYLIIIALAIVLAGLALSFFKANKPKKRKKKAS